MFLPESIARLFSIFITVLQIVTISSSVVTKFPEIKTLTSTRFTPEQPGLQNKTLNYTISLAGGIIPIKNKIVFDTGAIKKAINYF